jgi:hypothetical protein
MILTIRVASLNLGVRIILQFLLDSDRPGCERMRLISSTQAIKKSLPEREVTKI